MRILQIFRIGKRIFQIGESVHFGITEVKVEYLRSLLGLWKIFQKFKCNA